MEFEYTPREELESRVARFQKALQENEIAGALISQSVDLFYFSGTIQSSYLFIPAQGKPVLAVQKSFERAQEESNLDQIVPLKSTSHLGQALSDFNFSMEGQIGLELDVLPVKHYFSLC
ncbi:MAG: aminopeptidase P family N-terminal domain-containing protein, partial [Chloroflexota bacterium]